MFSMLTVCTLHVIELAWKVNDDWRFREANPRCNVVRECYFAFIAMRSSALGFIIAFTKVRRGRVSTRSRRSS